MTPGKLQQMRSSDSGYGSKIASPRDSIHVEDDRTGGQNTTDDALRICSKTPIRTPINKNRFSLVSNTEDDIFESAEPQVPAKDKLRFYRWCLSVAAGQGWKDVKSLNLQALSTAPFSRDLFDRYIMLPMANKEPRLLASGPGEHIELYRLADVDAYQAGKIHTLAGLPTQRLINLASNNYGGFASLEPGALNLQERTLRLLPMTPAPPVLEEEVRREFKGFMDFDACAIASSGFNCNMLAFKAVADVAAARGKACVFLCDRDSHSSMWTGAYSNRGARTLKFEHNSVGDLDARLRECARRWPGALVCVAIEGTYSMEGTVPPLPAILALKKAYGFALLVDEAHSFLGLGAEGRGSFEYWRDQGFDCPSSAADVLTCTFSKSAGCLGGAVLANGDFARYLGGGRADGDGVAVSGQGPCGNGLASAVLVRVLQLLRKRKLVRHRMAMLSERSYYVAKRLASAGCKILGSPGSPNICFPVGTVHRLSSCIKDSIDNGLALSCGVPPATSLWCCRVRASIFATMSWDDIDRAVVEISRIGVEHGIPGMHKIESDPNLTALKSTEELHRQQEAALEEEARMVDSGIEDLIDSLAAARDRPVTVSPGLRQSPADGGVSGLGRHQAVVDAGAVALRRYGIGPCSARHYYGCFDTYLQLEKKLAGLYPCLAKQTGKCEALLCGDAQISIGAAVAARAQVPRQKDAYTLVLVPESSPGYVHSALSAVKDNPRCVIGTYKSTGDIFRLIHNENHKQKPNEHKRCYLTLYVRSGLDDELDLPQLLRDAAALRRKKLLVGATVLLDDTLGLGRLGPRRLGYLDQLEGSRGANVLADATSKAGGSRAFQIVVIGSFYSAFGHTGGYMIGSKAAIDALNFQNRGFIFSAPPLPLQTAMTGKVIEMLEGMAGSGFGRGLVRAEDAARPTIINRTES